MGPGPTEQTAGDPSPQTDPPLSPPADPPPAGATAGEDRSATPKKRSKRWLVEWGVVIVVAVVLAVVVRAFFLQTFFVPSTSMYPTLKPGDRIVVEKITKSVQSGDVIVFTTPPAEAGKCGGSPVPDLVKRVIGMPGDTLEVRNDQIYLTGKVLPQPWLPAPTANSDPQTADFGPVKVPEGDYFVMGDNRGRSCDSRTWGPIEASSVVGKVIMVIWPLSRFHFL